MTRTLGTFLTACLASVMVTALAAEPKPNFAIRTKSIEASVISRCEIKAAATLAAER